MSSNYLLPQWQPQKRFSIFRFGTPITPHVLAGFAVRVPDLGPVPHATYECAEIDTLILTQDRVITRVVVAKRCEFEGRNLIGMHQAEVTNILGDPPVEWNCPEPTWLEKLGTIPAACAMLDVCVASGSVHSLSLWGTCRPSLVH